MTCKLYGLRTDYMRSTDGKGVRKNVKDLVATFDDISLAQEYVEKSYLSVARQHGFRPNISRGQYKFRMESVLRMYEGCVFEMSDEGPPPPHNPKIY
nr:hypothetical protein 21 [bacterium]